MWLLAGLSGEIARESARGKKREERKEWKTRGDQTFLFFK
jgi:hypothetical protein